MNKYLKKATVLVCLFFIAISGYTSNNSKQLFSEKALSQYQRLLSGDLSPISSIASQEQHYLNLYRYTLSVFLIDTLELDQFEEVFDQSIASFKSGAGSFNNQYFEADARLQASLVYFKFGNQLDAAWQLRQSYRISSSLLKVSPDFLPAYKTYGLLNLLLGSVPEKYQWLLSLAGLNGNINEGKEFLTKVSLSEAAVAKEAFLLSLISQAYILGETTKINNTFQRDKLNTLITMALASKNKEGNEIIDIYNSSSNNAHFPQSYYLLAEAYFQKAEYAEAEKNYEIFIANFFGDANKKDALFKLYLISKFHKGNTPKANELLNELNKMNAITTADKNAETLLENENFNFSMFKLRMAIDGGYNKLAIKLFGELKLYNKSDSIEAIYRNARLQHQLGNITGAKKLYSKTIIQPRINNSYFAPNSALQLGLIFEENNQLDSATYFYETALEYKHHVYKNSIDAKAEAGLNRINTILSD
ncbi:tetratricopeptide repeat protein [Fulvivirga lutea]|uniref:Tetratricopeptide repeat protein n=1 Tax=Fulvivirga lutea TaxID=2810512 RepID=A0A974WEG4_9BACT|nr:hypothetical protein [Fulvivirga lutea]QSE96838.1 hypothetical protein JR347_14725 [Fulvivirga lutea]